MTQMSQIPETLTMETELEMSHSRKQFQKQPLAILIRIETTMQKVNRKLFKWIEKRIVGNSRYTKVLCLAYLTLFVLQSGLNAPGLFVRNMEETI